MCVCTFSRVCTYVCMCVRVCVYVCVHVCVYAWTETDSEFTNPNTYGYPTNSGIIKLVFLYPNVQPQSQLISGTVSNYPFQSYLK